MVISTDSPASTQCAPQTMSMVAPVVKKPDRSRVTVGAAQPGAFCVTSPPSNGANRMCRSSAVCAVSLGRVWITQREKQRGVGVGVSGMGVGVGVGVGVGIGLGVGVGVGLGVGVDTDVGTK